MENKKTIIITGASSGIGLQTALKLQADGNTIIWTSRKAESDRNIKQLLKGRSIAMNLDVTDEESVKNAFGHIRKTYGKLDGLVNCAGFVSPFPMMMTDLSIWKKTLDTNLTGPFLCCKYATPLMKKSGGKIINLASTAGTNPHSGWSAYSASKGGVIAFSKTISEELSDYGIKVFSVSPGRTATPMRKILAPEEDPTSIMQPEKVAAMIAFCFTPEADVLEGQNLIVRERF